MIHRILSWLNDFISKRTKQLCLLLTVTAAISWLTYGLLKHGAFYSEWNSAFSSLCMLAGGAYAAGKFAAVTLSPKDKAP